MGVNKKVLSEVYYKNGFFDGAMAPMYIAIGPLEVIKTMSHDLEALQGEIETSSLNGSIIDIYEYLPNTWEKPTLISQYDWSLEEHRYIKRKNLKN